MSMDTSDAYAQEKAHAMEVLHDVIDPELFVNIVDLGLIYDLDFVKDQILKVTMTLSTPHCPMGESIVAGVHNVLEPQFPDRKVEVELVWEPEWTMEKITEEGKRQLGISQ